MQLDSTILSEYKKISGRDIQPYFVSAVNFFRSDYNTIVSYYSGNIKTISSEPFTNFESLLKENDSVLEYFKSHRKRLNNLKWILLIEQVEEIDSRLKTLKKINKWCRSSITSVAYNPSFQLDYQLGQNQTLENVSSTVTGSTNPNDDWVDIATSNSLREEDYTPNGGNDLKLQFQNSNRVFNITSVVDTITGKSIYGKDIYKKIQWDIANNDLTVLGYDATIYQAASILANLRKNDNPDAPNNGLQTSIVVGNSRAAFSFPIVVRQMNATFANDDTLKNFKVGNISIKEDNVYIDWSVQTRLNEIIDSSVI